MGLASNQLRLLYLTLFKSDLEYRVQLVTQTKLHLSNSMNGLIDAGNDLDPDSPEMKLLEQRRQRLQITEKKLDAEIERNKTLLNAINTEVQAAEKFVQESAKSFNYAR